MRAFIAIELAEKIKNILSDIQNQLRTSGADVKWVEPKNIHLTLKFLGEIDEKKLGKIIQILEETIQDKSSFHVHLSSLGAFPKIDFPRVIWVGIDKGDNETREIAQELEEKLTSLSIPKETRPFSSHITIGRTRSILNRQSLVQNLKALADKPILEDAGFTVTKITLFKSTLTPQGPIYEIIKEVNLKTI